MKSRMKTLKAELAKIDEKVEALPTVFTLKSGRLVSYSVATRHGAPIIRLHEVFEPGHPWQGLSGVEYGVTGDIEGFRFGSFSGYNNAHAQNALEYTQNCAELLSPEFRAKIAADYNSKKGEFESLSRQHDEIYTAIQKAEQAA